MKIRGHSEQRMQCPSDTRNGIVNVLYNRLLISILHVAMTRNFHLRTCLIITSIITSFVRNSLICVTFSYRSENNFRFVTLSVD